ncbi:GntR family transcriptional regulator [Vreelandella neptunia]|uniref:GntR family transcriptional regulator n=1 Tax=Vreelandella neptunia TaxID=115551 RepID=A0ABS9SC10_9GAMM|nr:GntR family transcriptional regulator [Halomonas neptunia]MCH4813636.1 GntR family transcriptional regulator [Halomonas neptunia]
MGTLKDQLYHILVESMECGHLETGLVLLESNISEIFKLSRSPVRQTLARLHDEEKISRFDGRGYLVGNQPKEVIRRQITEKDFSLAGGEVSVRRIDSWRKFAEEIERDIVYCSMLGRMELNELKLAKSLDVSRTTTQKILLYLQSLGLVENNKYSSWTVVPLDDDRLHQLYAARQQLEPFMIAQATGRLPDSDIKRYIERLDSAENQYPNIQGRLLDELENDLHQHAMVAGGNDEVVTMLQRTRPILLISKHLLGGKIDFPQSDPFFDEHREVFSLMLLRKSEQARKSLFRHLTASESKVQHRLEQFRDNPEVKIPEYLARIIQKDAVRAR